MGCYSSKPKFSFLHKQNDIVEMMINEKIKFQRDLQYMESKTNPIPPDNLKQEEVRKDSLEAFIDGLTILETEFKNNICDDVGALAKIMDRFFILPEGFHKGNAQEVKNEVEAIRQWLKNHIKK